MKVVLKDMTIEGEPDELSRFLTLREEKKNVVMDTKIDEKKGLIAGNAITLHSTV